MIKNIIGIMIFIILISCQAVRNRNIKGIDKIGSSQKEQSKKSGQQKLKTKLIDTLTNDYFTLDSKHVVVTAFDKEGKILWKTNPYKDNKIEENGAGKIEIIHFDFTVIRSLSGKVKFIQIGYNNGNYGFLELKTGTFIFFEDY
jgi:hypothetical protein